MGVDFKTLPIRLAYDSGTEDVLWDFYIPVLSYAVRYDRIAGFFSSSSLALSARGFESFISRGGKMRLVTCPKLSAEDIAMMANQATGLDDVLTNNFILDYSKFEFEFQRDHVRALGWMLRNGSLEIKIAVVKKHGKICSGEEIEHLGLMHQKVGILYDACGNVLSFSGSNNESASGWMKNTEEFKVFKGWGNGSEYVAEDQKKFNSFWNGERPDISIVKIPDAIKSHLLKESENFEPERIAIRHYVSSQQLAHEKEELKLFFYQENAVNAWKENKRYLLIQMATGCGKTRTAIKCMDVALRDTSKLLVVIACPQVTLSSQWKKDVDKLKVKKHHSLEINGGVRDWVDKLRREYRKLKIGLIENLVVYTTHQICSDDKFIAIVGHGDSGVTKFLIGDEVHGMGADKAQSGLLTCYNYRIGLSATPQRWFDDAGSELIANYFDGHSFEFSIKDALENFNPLTGKPYLVNFVYEPRFVKLTENELSEYKRLTDKLSRLSNCDNNETHEWLQMLRFQRAAIGKNAENKYLEFERVLDEIGDGIKNTLIFVSDEQIDRVLAILEKRGIMALRFTQEVSATKDQSGMSERECAINVFKEMRVKVLVAIKCLDEGIDIPSADTAILMASSTNPREYVQRVGRVIRQSPGKTKAVIYDLIIEPSTDDYHNAIHLELEKRIFKKEMVRVLELSENAMNNTTVLNAMYEKQRSVFV